MASARFDKYEGLGNDFIVVERGEPVGAERARALCDRHFGIGGDGVLVVGPAKTRGARATMTVENADGSRPEMCGNGLRCVALHLARRDGADSGEFVVDTDAGPRRCLVERTGDTGMVAIDMGRAESLGDYAIKLEGTEYAFSRVSAGNPHAIALGIPDLTTIDRVGPEVSRRIAGGTNVEFVEQLGPRHFRVVVWERGVGRTLACGTGAVATAAALARLGRAPFDEPLDIELPGGSLEVSVTAESAEVLMTRLRGPARRVFSGELG